MVCPSCIIFGFAGGFAVERIFGVIPPKTGRGKMVVAILTGTLTATTSFVLKVFYQVPLCGKSQSMAGRIVLAFLKAQILGVIYSIPISLLIRQTSLNECKGNCPLKERVQYVDLRVKKYSQIAMGIFLIAELVSVKFVSYKNVFKISPSLLDRVVLVLGIIEAHYLVYMGTTKIVEKVFAKKSDGVRSSLSTEDKS